MNLPLVTDSCQAHVGEQVNDLNSPAGNFSRRDALALLLLAGLVALFFWRILTPNLADRRQFPAGDFTDQFYAFRLYEARAFAAGRLPLWSENYNSGHPFLADVQAAVFYPIGLANTLLNVAVLGGNFSLFALELEALLHFWLAGAFTFLFARRVIGARVGALAAALVFTFGGYLTSYPPLQLAILETAAWLPLALLWIDKAAVETKGRFVSTLAAGLTLGVSALAGHPQTFLFVLAACAVYFVFRSWSAKLEWRKGISSAMLMLCVAFGLAAVQLIPSLEYQRLSTREALSFGQAAAGFPTLDLLQFIFPGFTSAFASPLYVGGLSLWLAMVALRRRNRERWFWGLLALGALIFSFGFYVFAYAALYALVPGVGLFRQQERLAFIVSFALAMLAGFGLNDLLAMNLSQSPLNKGGHRGVVSIRRLFLLLPAGAVVAFTLLLAFFVAGAQQGSPRLAFLGDRAGLMLLLFFIASVLAGAYVKGWFSPRVFMVLALAFVLFDLFSVNEPANKGEVVERYAEPGPIQTVQRDSGLFRMSSEAALPGHFGIGYQLEEIGGISPLRLAHYDELLQLDPSQLWNLLNVKYVYAERAIPNARSIGADGKNRLWQLDDPGARAWLVGEAFVLSGDEEEVEFMSASLDLQRSAVLASKLPFPIDPRAVGGKVTVETHAPERMTLTVDTPADGLLVVSENYYPGWSARVDGAPVEILRTDVSLRGIPLRAGRHHVELVYDPWSVKLGAGLSILTLLLCLGAIGRLQRRRA